MVERMQCNVQSDAINLTTLNYSATVIVHISQCSTLVRNTVVRAILQAYGKWWISTPWGAETAEPIEMKLGMGDYVGDPTPHAQNEKCT